MRLPLPDTRRGRKGDWGRLLVLDQGRRLQLGSPQATRMEVACGMDECAPARVVVVKRGMPTVRTVHTSTHGRVLIDGGVGGSSHPLLVGFHGYGENAERHLGQLRSIPGTEGWTLAAVQGLHRFYAAKGQEVVASWMTREDRELAIADNIAYVDRVMALLAAENGAATRVVYLGFSQGVAMAFRAAVLGASRASGVIALGGDVPPHLWEEPSARFPRVLLGRGSADSWYTEEKLRTDVEHLRSKHVSVEVAAFEGGHEWTDEFRLAASQFLNSLLP